MLILSIWGQIHCDRSIICECYLYLKNVQRFNKLLLLFKQLCSFNYLKNSFRRNILAPFFRKPPISINLARLRNFSHSMESLDLGTSRSTDLNGKRNLAIFSWNDKNLSKIHFLNFFILEAFLKILTNQKL